MRAAPSGRLRIGPALIGLAVASRSDLRHEVAPYLERLSHELRETVDLAVLDAGEVLFIDQYVSRRTLRIVSEIGATSCTPRPTARRCWRPCRPTSSSSCCPGALRRPPRTPSPTEPNSWPSSSIFCATGLAYDREEFSSGIASVGTAVRDAIGAVAAVTVVVPASRFAESEAEITATLLRTRDEIQAVLSGE